LIDLKGFMILFLIWGWGKSIIVVYTKLPMLVIDDSYENIKLTKIWGIMVNELYDGWKDIKVQSLFIKKWCIMIIIVENKLKF